MINIRPRAAEDLASLASLLRRVHETHGYPVNLPDDIPGWLTPDSQVGSWAADLDGQPVGHVSLTATADPTDPSLWVERLFVAPSAGGHGIGRQLLSFAEEEAARRDLQLRLEVADNCTAAIRLYRRLGWSSYAQEPIDWGRDLATHLLLFRPPATTE